MPSTLDREEGHRMKEGEPACRPGLKSKQTACTIQARRTEKAGPGISLR